MSYIRELSNVELQDAELLPNSDKTKSLIPSDVWKAQHFIFEDMRRILDLKMISNDIDAITSKTKLTNTPGKIVETVIFESILQIFR